MALQASSFLCASGSISSRSQRGNIVATISLPKLRTSSLSLPKLQTRGLVEELRLSNTTTTTTYIQKQSSSPKNNTRPRPQANDSDPMVIAKLYAIMEAVSDRAEMHKNIGEQRNNWNSLLLTSINAITLAAATMTGIAATSSIGAPMMAVKTASTLMYLSATGMLLIMNKLQPSQLVEEQRNASRLFKQLHGQIHTLVSIGNPTVVDVKEAMEKVLALDRAYPLPLIGVMLEKFPSAMEPAVWWPQQRWRKLKENNGKMDWNGWNGKLEEEMKEIVGIMERKDKADYLRLGEKALKLNKVLAITGPLLTGLAAVGSAFVGSSPHGSWAAVLGVLGGALVSIVNTVEHGGQVGMVFEMYRSNAGFFRLMEESIESNLNESDVGRRENRELFEMKVALQLGRSLLELRDLAASSSRKGRLLKNLQASFSENFDPKNRPSHVHVALTSA